MLAGKLLSQARGALFGIGRNGGGPDHRGLCAWTADIDRRYLPRAGDLALLWSSSGCVDLLTDENAFCEYWAGYQAQALYGMDAVFEARKRELAADGRVQSLDLAQPLLVRVERADRWKGGKAAVRIVDPATHHGLTGFVLADCLAPAEQRGAEPASRAG